MKRKKTGWLGTLRSKIWAGIASLLTTIGGSTLAYYWGDLTGKNPPEAAVGGGAPTKLPTVVIGTLTALQKTGKVSTCEMLGSDVSENRDHISIVGIRPGSIGAQLGLMPGDIIESVDNQRIDSPEILEGSLARSRKLFSTDIKVRRGDAILRGEVHLNNQMHLAVRRPLAP